MRLFEPPLTMESQLVTTAGGLAEPVWTMLSLVMVTVALITTPWRWWIASVLLAVFGIHLWFVQRALSAWTHLNQTQQDRPHADLAPIAVMGEGWYLTLMGACIVLLALVLRWWQHKRG
jgi:hypothetical protein